jgi:hypothetical protein
VSHQKILIEFSSLVVQWVGHRLILLAIPWLLYLEQYRLENNPNRQHWFKNTVNIIILPAHIWGLNSFLWRTVDVPTDCWISSTLVHTVYITICRQPSDDQVSVGLLYAVIALWRVSVEPTTKMFNMSYFYRLPPTTSWGTWNIWKNNDFLCLPKVNEMKHFIVGSKDCSDSGIQFRQKYLKLRKCRVELFRPTKRPQETHIIWHSDD